MEAPKKSIYIETTIPSYATSRASRDFIKAHRQAVTRMFWDYERHKYDLYISKFVIDECAKGDSDAAKRRLDFIEGIELVEDNGTSAKLTEEYFELLGIPISAKTDCAHLAVCVCAEIDYILSWNCNHIGMESYAKVYEYNQKFGLWTPKFFTPEMLMDFEKESVDV